MPGLVNAGDEPELHTEIVEVARDRVSARVSGEFTGHESTALISAILEAGSGLPQTYTAIDRMDPHSAASGFRDNPSGA